MKFYLCARYSRRDELRTVRTRLEAIGHQTTSRWLDTDWEGIERQDKVYSSAAPPEYREEYACKDMGDVAACDCLIAFTEEPRSGGRGGRHVEFGAAIALNKRLIVVGFRENLFYHHPDVEFCENETELFVLLETTK